jgi:hypothetical protein
MAQTALLRMINQQGDALDRICGLEFSGHASVLAGASRVVLAGTGTSQHAAELGAMMLGRAGRNACWYPALTWARWSPGPQPGDVLLVISHTASMTWPCPRAAWRSSAAAHGGSRRGKVPSRSARQPGCWPRVSIPTGCCTAGPSRTRRRTGWYCWNRALTRTG